MFITIIADEVVQGRNDDVLDLSSANDINRNRYLGVFVGKADMLSYGSLGLVIHPSMLLDNFYIFIR